MPTPALSVIVPAHDEATVIGRLLDALGPGIESGELDVVVVPNGCRDHTASVAARPGVRVVELADGSKPAALNAGDAAAGDVFPRFYVDADVIIDHGGLERLAAALASPGVLAVAPRFVLDTADASWPVRSYHRIWERLPSVVDSLAGRGCFGVSGAGRRRWGAFPDLIADDQFANQQFRADERVTVESVTSSVRVPRTVRDLIARKRRIDRGNVELAAVGGPVTSATAWLGVIGREPRLLVHAPVFVAVTIVSRILGAVDRRRGRRTWDSDRSTRVAS